MITCTSERSGNRVERHARDRIDAGQRHENGRKPDQKDVARRPADESGNHFGASGWVKACSAALQIALGVDQEGRGGDDLFALA